MTDIFLRDDMRRLVAGKKVVFLGGSNVRCYYKDFLCLFHQSAIIEQTVLKTKMEKSVFGDTLVNHSEKTNARIYREDRRYCVQNSDFSFYFITRVYNEHMEQILTQITQDKQPDLIIINSCIWDMCRWGPEGVEEYKENLVKLMKRLQEMVNPDCLVLWITAPPLSQQPRGGLLVVGLDFVKYTLRFHVMEANVYARKVVQEHGYDVLDVHYHLRMQLDRRCSDGIHWNPMAVRYVTNLILTHVSLAWGVSLPRRSLSGMVKRVLDQDSKDPSEPEYVQKFEKQRPATVAPAAGEGPRFLKAKRQRQPFLPVPNHHPPRNCVYEPSRNVPPTPNYHPPRNFVPNIVAEPHRRQWQENQIPRYPTNAPTNRNLYWDFSMPARRY